MSAISPPLVPPPSAPSPVAPRCRRRRCVVLGCPGARVLCGPAPAARRPACAAVFGVAVGPWPLSPGIEAGAVEDSNL